MSKRVAEGDRDWQAVRRIISRVFDLEDLRPGQEEVIRSVLAGRDTLAVMPTGAGKSLCYQAPGLHTQGTTIVVSPLISLMQDQAGKLEGAGIEATGLHSGLSRAQSERAEGVIARSTCEFVLVTPERLEDEEFVETMRRQRIDLVVVDEAHCVSQWGHDFRPSYLRIRDAVEALGRPPVLALTATAPPEVADDIVRQLGMRDVQVVNTGTYRPNLHYAVFHADSDDDKDVELLRRVREHQKPGIVYAATVRTTDRLHDVLTARGLRAGRYHGRRGARERADTQRQFMARELDVLVATNAFGMGVDKPDIRFVIHYDLPGSLDAYYQESGRAGRDGDRADCVLLFRRADRRTQLFFLRGRYPNADGLLAVVNALHAGRGAGSVALHDLQETVPLAKNKVRVALSMLKRAAVVRETRGARYALLVHDVDASLLERLAVEYEARDEADHERLDRMVAWAQSARCRWRGLVDYFGGDMPGETCGTCDNCVKASTRTMEDAAPASRVRTDLLRGRFVRMPGRGPGVVEETDDETVVIRWEDGERERLDKRTVPPQDTVGAAG